MFATLSAQPKDASGNTPVMRAVKEAERRIVADQSTKAYTGLAGDPAFAELIRIAAPNATVWISNPSWPNHASIVKFLGMKMGQYRYFDADTRGVDFDGMMADLREIPAGDVVLLHGCCHNPTGANLTADQMDQVIALMQERGLMPFVDIAYQGFGDGLAQDSAATRAIAAGFDNVLIAASCSKNFGVYRERTGILMAITKGGDETGVTQQNLNFLNRQNYSFPPDHGARVVTTILTDPALNCGPITGSIWWATAG